MVNYISGFQSIEPEDIYKLTRNRYYINCGFDSSHFYYSHEATADIIDDLYGKAYDYFDEGRIGSIVVWYIDKDEKVYSVRPIKNTKHMHLEYIGTIFDQIKNFKKHYYQKDVWELEKDLEDAKEALEYWTDTNEQLYKAEHNTMSNIEEKEFYTELNTNIRTISDVSEPCIDITDDDIKQLFEEEK